MKPDRIAGPLALGLTLAACSPEPLPRDAAPDATAAATDSGRGPAARNDRPAAGDVPPGRPAATPEPPADPDPQVGVELPEPPVRVPENPPPG